MAASAVAVPSLSGLLHLGESENTLERREVDFMNIGSLKNTNTSCLHRKCQNHDRRASHGNIHSVQDNR